MSINYRTAVKNNVDVEFIQLSAYDILILPYQFDFIITRYVLAHLRDPSFVIANCSKKLKHNGILVCDEMADE